MQSLRTISILGLCAAGIAVAAAPVGDQTLLLRAYFQVLLIQQMPAQVRHVTQEFPGVDAAQVQPSLTAWTEAQLAATKGALNARLGEQSRERFEQFVADYSIAESQVDVRFLKSLVAGLGLEQNPPRTYQALHELVATTLLTSDIQAASKFLSDLQTWLKLKANTPDTPPLQAWLQRDQPRPAAAAPAPVRTQLLAEREAAPAEFKSGAEPGPSMRATYAAARKERQARNMEAAQAGMQQVAAERQAAEQELAAHKTAAAQAEGEAMKSHAQKLAAVEQQALEQQQNSWGNKLKGVVGATISAAGGAFLGGIGTQAGQVAADALFK
jgi:hypothetical protein